MPLFIKIFFLVCFVFVNSQAFTQSKGTKFIKANHSRLNYTGRIGKSDSCAAFYWSGRQVSLVVKNVDTFKVLISDTRDNNFFYVIIDGDSSTAKKIKISSKKRCYTLATFEDKLEHEIQLFKITNTDDHITRLYGFELNKNATLLKAAKKPKRSIEFFGNSITCGHGVVVPADSADSGAPEYFNNYRTYGAITARYFNANYHSTAKSGIGMTVSWFPQIMSEIYNRLNPDDSLSRWNFRQFIPDIVVVNLLQNDSWLVNTPEHNEFKIRFGTVKPTDEYIINDYASFIHSVRSKYPCTKIICSLGNMDATKNGSKFMEIIEQAVASLGDKRVVTHFFVYKNSSGHPKILEQEAMAKSLIKFIEKKLIWK